MDLTTCVFNTFFPSFSFSLFLPSLSRVAVSSSHWLSKKSRIKYILPIKKGFFSFRKEEKIYSRRR